MNFQTLFILSAFLLLSACGDTFKDDKKMRIYDIDSPNALEASANWEVRCKNSSDCPSTVAQLLVVAGGKGGVCTATLIGRDLALTNSHCFDFLPSRSAQNICAGGRSVLIFASNSRHGREVVECESVVQKSVRDKKGFSAPDSMVLKLKKSLDRGYETIDPSGLPDGEKLTIKKVNPVRQGLGELEVDRCEVIHSTIFMPKNTNPLAPVHVTRGCRVIQGNSGSSLFDSRGNVRGVIFATLDPDNISNKEIEGMGEIQQVLRRVKAGYITNASCISLYPGHRLPTDCEIRFNSSEISVDEAEGFAEIKRDAQRRTTDPGYRYQLFEGETVKLKVKISHRPVCYQPEQLPRIPTSRVLITNWYAQVGITDRLKTTLKVKEVRQESCQFVTHLSGDLSQIIMVKPATLECSLAQEMQPNWNMVEKWQPCTTRIGSL